MTTAAMPSTPKASLPKQSLLQRLRMLRDIVRQRMAEDRTAQQAAALTYNTLFSILPTIVLALIVMSMVLTTEQVTHEEMIFFKHLGLTSLSTRGANGENSQLFITTLTNQVQKMRSVLQNPSTGVVGFITLLWGAISLMRVIETAFGHIYRVVTPRPWGRRLTLYWCVLTLGPLGLGISFYLSGVFVAMASSVAAGSVFLAPLSFIGSEVTLWLMIFLFYKLIPNTLVKWQSAMIGALVATVLYELGKYGFGLYVHYLAGYGKWYGNLGLIPLFMFWIYLTWNFMLMGLEVSFVHQHYAVLRRRLLQARQSSSTLVDSRWVLPMAVLMVRQFKLGKTVDADTVSNRLGISPEIAGELLEALEASGLAHGMDGQTRQYSLAKDPQSTTLDELLRAAAARCHSASEAMHTASEHDSPLRSPGMLEYQELEQQWSKSRTLAALAG